MLIHWSVYSWRIEQAWSNNQRTKESLQMDRGEQVHSLIATNAAEANTVLAKKSNRQKCFIHYLFLVVVKLIVICGLMLLELCDLHWSFFLIAFLVRKGLYFLLNISAVLFSIS